MGCKTMPMNRTQKRLLPLLLATSAMLMCVQAYTATVSGESHASYRRLNFAFPMPAQMRVARTGTTVTLSFNQVLNVAPADIKAQLGEYVTAVTQSSDGKTIILTLKNDVAVRQFNNGKTIGIDILGEDPAGPQSPETKSAENPPFKRAVTREPVSQKAIASTVKAAPIATVETGADSDLYTTKKTAPAGTETPTPTSPTSPTAPAAAPTSAPAAAAVPKSATSLLVTTRKTNDGTVMNFPWTQRTAAAVYERPRTIWIVFSHEADPHVKQLATVLPKQVVRVQQYAYPGALVLRLTTDGSLHATASQSGNNYEWNITLNNTAPRPALDTAVTVDTANNVNSMLFNVFDVAPPLQFFDPILQDRMVVVPTFETSRGVGLQRSYPELTLLSTQQGIAMIAQRNDVVADVSRQGVRVTSSSSLAVSPSLPMLTEDDRPIRGISARSDVLIPYDQWYVPARDFFRERQLRLSQVAHATEDDMPFALQSMMALYMGSDFMPEAAGYLQIIKSHYPDFYAEHKLALVSAACNVYMNHLPEALMDLNAKELENLDEAKMWRDIVMVLAPNSAPAAAVVAAATSNLNEALNRNAVAPLASAPNPGPGNAQPVSPPTYTAPTLDFATYNKRFIRFYPTHLRQRIVQLVANAPGYRNKENAVLEIYNSLANDGILPSSIDGQSKILIAKVLAKKNHIPEAIDALNKVVNESRDLRAQTEAQYNILLMRFSKGEIDADTVTYELENLKLAWRGDWLEHDILMQLAQIYYDNKRYGDTLRSWKSLIDAFPTDPEVLKLSADMSELFENLFLKGEADSMPPLESLATFYEFRELTPVGERGDMMIQKLADRLAGVDLIDRAVQLLKSQIKFRLSGEARSRVGARLAILQLVNNQPQEALSTIETTNFTGSAPDLQLQRAEISARALASLGRTEDALSLLANDRSNSASLLRLDIFWDTKDWPNVINQAEDLLGSRANLTAPLNTQETDILLKLVLGYTFENDRTQLKYLRDYYSGLLTDTSYKQIFDYLTNDTSPLDPEDFALVAKQISHTESFMDIFKQKIAQGKLSEAIK